MAITYNTLGNEIKYKITNGELTAYIDNATIKFPLPEASADILGTLLSSESINPIDLEVVTGRLVDLGFKKVKAEIMASVLVTVAKQQGIDPMEYFDNDERALKLANDTYQLINALRPVGNQIGLTLPIKNSQSRYRNLIKP